MVTWTKLVVVLQRPIILKFEVLLVRFVRVKDSLVCSGCYYGEVCNLNILSIFEMRYE